MDSNEIVIRNATFSDIISMTSLLRMLFEIEEDFVFDEVVQNRGLALLLGRCGKHRCVRVAEVNNQVVGMCSVQTLISSAEGGVVALLEDLVVSPESRRKRVGKKLLQSIEVWCREHGISRIQLLADRTNDMALNFYDHQEWEKTQLICLRKAL